MEVYGIVAFRSRQAVLRFQEEMNREGLSSTVIHTPSQISLGCGLSVRFRLNDLFDVTRLLVAPYTQSLIGIYAASDDGRSIKLIPLEW